MGFSVGVAELQDEAAWALNTSLGGMKVCIAAPKGPVDDNHADDLFDRIGEIRTGLTKGKHVFVYGSTNPVDRKQIKLKCAVS
jgi:hypothetical protein